MKTTNVSLSIIMANNETYCAMFLLGGTQGGHGVRVVHVENQRKTRLKNIHKHTLSQRSADVV